MSTSNLPKPRRGGLIEGYGPYVGGSAMNLDYTLTCSTAANYRSISQVRAIRTLPATEQMLHRYRDDTSSLKFNGKLNTITTSTTTELNKVAFEGEIRRLIKLIGLQTFFYVPSADKSEMVYLPEQGHKVNLLDVIAEHNERLSEPNPVTTNDAQGNLVETQDSIDARFKCYDTYELRDIQLSRLVIDSLISPALRLQVLTRFRHDKEFDDYPGSVHLMMVYEVVNASTNLDISQATTLFADLELSNFPGENVSTFVDEALRLIHILECGYALPYQLGSQLLEKLVGTASSYFNMQVQLLLHEARTMEDTIGPIGNPKSLESHAKYTTHGPVALCSNLQTLYSGLLKSNSWPAIADSVPEGNNASFNPGRNTDESNSDPKVDSTTNTTSNDSNNRNPKTGNEEKVSIIALSPKVWKYIKPADPDQIIKVKGKEYFWCSKCTCYNSGKTGMYNLTHRTSQHKRGVGREASSGESQPSPNDTSDSANLSSVVKPSSNPSSITQTDKANKKVAFSEPETKSEDEKSTTDEDDFQFHGAFMHSAEDGVWMTPIDDDKEDAEYLNQPLPPPQLQAFNLNESENSETEINSAFTSTVTQPRIKENDPFVIAAANLSLSAIANEMHQDGFAVDTVLTGNEDGAESQSESATFGPPRPPSMTQPTLMSTIDSSPPTVANNPFRLQNLPNLTQSQLDKIPTQGYDPQIAMAMVALAEAAEPRDLLWPSNVVSALPGMTLYDIDGSPHLIFKDIHAQAHCTYCGRLGDWITPCRCGAALHTLSDDEDYSDGHLEIHWDSDVDTAEYLATDEDTDGDTDEDGEDEENELEQVTNNNSSFTHYSHSSFLSVEPFFMWFLFLGLSKSPVIIYHWISILISNLSLQVWNFISFWLLLFAAISWDTIYHYLDPKAPQQPFRPRRIHRLLATRTFQPLPAYNKGWLILSTFMLFNGIFSNRQHPFHSFSNAPLKTAATIKRLHDLVDITPSTHLHYSSFRLDEILALPFFQRSSVSKLAIASSLEEPFIPSFHHQHFFNSYSSFSEMEGDLVDLDYYLCPEPTWMDTTFNFSDLMEPHHHIFSSIHQQDHQHSHPPSVQAYTALSPPTLGNVDLYPLNEMPTSFPVIVDSGASLAISPSETDFVGPIHYYDSERLLGGMAGGMNIKGIGKVAWSFKTDNGILTVHSKCYLVPSANARLLSPQRLFSTSNNINGCFSCYESHATLEFDDVGKLNIEYDPNNHLPIAMAKNLSGTSAQINLAVLDESNQNLTAAQKLLLLWHSKFGHKGFSSLQRILRHSPFTSERFKGASKCTIPRCEVCERAKAHRQPTKGAKQSTNPTTNGSLKKDDLVPGSSVSVDHFESRLKGRTLESFGKSSHSYKGGCIFVDHMSGFIHVEEQLGFSASESIRAKQVFEKFALDHGVIVHNYLTDNGTFKSKNFVKHLHEHNQKVQYCGVNAHHQNGIAERSIRTVSECARAVLLHSALRWKDGPIDSTFWPFAVRYATYIYNHCPDSSGTCPADRFYGITVPRHKLLDLHCWGCPVYVLDPTLQQGRKLPKWQPRSRQGVFVGFSRVHSSDVPLVLNTRTGYISPQYHVVFDDTFSTVVSHSSQEEPPSFWNDIELDSFTYQVPRDNPPPHLDDDWLTPSELEEKQRYQLRTNAIRQTYPSTLPVSTKTTTAFIPDKPQVITKDLKEQTGTESVISKEPTSAASTLQSTLKDNPKEITSIEYVPPFKHSILPSPKTAVPDSSPTEPRRSTRSSQGIPPTHYMHEFNQHKALLATALDTTRTNHESNLAYMADVSMDLESGCHNDNDPRVYAAKHKVNDPDMPSLTEALSGQFSNEYLEAMKNEIRQLVKQKTWTAMYRKDVPLTNEGHKRPILKGTWAFKLKRFPDGTPMKFKARYCVRGDLQREGIDYFETYAPVVQWSTIRLVLTLILANNWVTKQVDYTNAFAQAELAEEVYIESPRCFSRKDNKNVLKLNNSLYGLKQAPKTFYEKLRDGLLERGFVQSMMDPCLFMKKDLICLIYVDDTIITGPNSQDIDDLIKSLGVAKDEQVHTFELRDEGEVGAFLGIQIERNKNNTFYLTQTGLIQKVLVTAGMENSKATVKTPAATTTLGLDVDGDEFSEAWDYPVIIGMLLYLAQNSRPDIAYAVHQCARFTHSPKQSHATAVKRILRYLNSTKDKGMYLKPTKDLNINCYVDADFAGLWKSEDDQDPLCVKSRTGVLITFMDCPLQWLSKLQSQIALSTMEAEYIALSQAMREVIGFREILKEIYSQVLNNSKEYDTLNFRTVSKTFGTIPQSTVHEDNEACLRFATVPKMSPRTKHIAIPYHFFRSKVDNGEIKVVAVDTNNQLADQFTKGLPQDKFFKDRFRLIGW